jgi:type VI secretion system protein ImpG
MLDELLPYYENELTSLRSLSKEFAARYPKIASRLSLEGDVCEDPHVERLIESFAFIASRIHK